MSRTAAPSPDSTTAAESPAADEAGRRLFGRKLQRLLEEVCLRLEQTASSLAVAAGRDFACAFCDRSGQLVAAVGPDPVLSGSLGAQVVAVLRGAAPLDWGRDGMIAVNDPHPDLPSDGVAAPGGLDPQTLTLIAPLTLAASSPIGATSDDSMHGYLALRVRHPQPPLGQLWQLGDLPLQDDDLSVLPPAVGPRYSGFQLPAAIVSGPRALDDEGSRLPPTAVSEALLRSLSLGAAARRERLGDLLAQRAALRYGVERLRLLLNRCGGELFAARCAQQLRYSAAAAAAAIARLPAGFYAFADSLDDDATGRADIAIRVVCIVANGRLQIDLSQSDDAVRGPLNLVAAASVAVVAEVLFRLLEPSSDALRNDGLLDLVTVTLRPGSLLAAPPPYGLALGLDETARRLEDVLFGALAQALPQRIPAAGAGTSSSLFLYGPGFVHREPLAGGRGGLAPGSEPVRGGLPIADQRFSAELLERRLAVRVLAQGLRRESGGPGNAAGSDGQQRELELLAPMSVLLAGERRRRPPYGLGGGGPGVVGSDRLERRDPEPVRRQLPGKVALHGRPGDRLLQQSPGGGGHGDAQRVAFFASLISEP